MQVWTNKERGGKADSHDYDIIKSDHEIALHYSNNKEWVWPGEKVGVLVDDGDGVVVKLKQRKPIVLDYGEVIEMLSLLLTNYQDKLEFRETKIIKSI